MTIDIDSEVLRAFAEATNLCPGRKKISLQTLHRWRLHGVRGVKLETILIGGMRYTSDEALRRFFEAQNATEQVAPAVTKSQRQKQAEVANRLLAEAGI